MEVGVLGPLQVSGPGGALVFLASRPQRRLMSLLTMRANGLVAADWLADHLGLSAGALRTSVSRLRKVIGADALVTVAPGYELRTDQTDAAAFERLLAQARAGDSVSARASLEEALSLWRAGAYPEFAHESWAIAEVTRLTELRVGAVETLAALQIDAEEHPVAIALLEPFIERHPFRDALRALLMRSLARSGRRTEALREFQDYRRFLADEVGTEPTTNLIELDRLIAVSEPGDPGLVGPSDRAARSARPTVATEAERVSDRSRGVFLFTDVIGSTRRWARHPESMAQDLAQHDRLVSTAIETHGGATFSTAGDSFAAVFGGVDDAVAAAVDIQLTLAGATWHLTDGLSLRIGIHLGDAERRAGGWYGPPLNEAARIMAAGHGGQILVSEPVAAAMTEASVVDLGQHHLRDLDGMRRLFQVTGGALRRDFPPLRSMGGYLTTLPAQRTSFIGQFELLSMIHERLAGHPVVTLLGPGGCGKTRAAVEAGGRELPHFRDGVFFVDLAKIASGADVVGAMLGGIGQSPKPSEDPAGVLTAHLAPMAALLVVDNCEHVLAVTAALVDSLLAVAPKLRVLATSREPLRVDGEHCLPVEPLDTEGPTSAAVRLFTDRALAADPSMALGDHELVTVAEITRHLDGIPLAIELAAARMRSLGLDQILGHLDERFRLLRDEHRRAASRQQTLEAAIDWSYDLLAPAEQRNFRFLAICAGPFTLPTVAGLLALDELGAAECLESLVAKSLVTPNRVVSAGYDYHLLESLRAYGQDRLAESHELPAAHAALERALLPPPEQAEDWTFLVNGYLSEEAAGGIVEDTTRRAAANQALDAGRLDAAALLYSSCAFRDDPADLVPILRMVRPLAGRRDELGPVAWRAANAATISLERLSRDYGACLETAARMVEDLDDEDPALPWFDMWRNTLTLAVAPELGLAEVDEVIAGAIRHARPPSDVTVSQMLTAKATGLALVGRLGDARDTAVEALGWAPGLGTCHDQALASFLWMRVASGESSHPAVGVEVSERRQSLGMAQFCAAPATVCMDAPVETRARELVRLARRRPFGDVATPYLLAFAWLAVERGELDRAGELAAVAELYDSSTEIALIYLLARLQDWTDDGWVTQRDAAIIRYLSPRHETAVKHGAGLLAEELNRWATRPDR